MSSSDPLTPRLDERSGRPTALGESSVRAVACG